jgi:uncharacterized Fe-S cluster protein YjdI
MLKQFAEDNENDKINIFFAGQAEVHLIYPPYNCAVHEQQRDPWIVPHTGSIIH